MYIYKILDNSFDIGADTISLFIDDTDSSQSSEVVSEPDEKENIFMGGNKRLQMITFTF